jgi:hypothetical protein
MVQDGIFGPSDPHLPPIRPHLTPSDPVRRMRIVALSRAERPGTTRGNAWCRGGQGQLSCLHRISLRVTRTASIRHAPHSRTTVSVIFPRCHAIFALHFAGRPCDMRRRTFLLVETIMFTFAYLICTSSVFLRT